MQSQVRQIITTYCLCDDFLFAWGHHDVPEGLWQALFGLLAQVHKQSNDAQEYAVDSLPLPVCDNIAGLR